MHVDVCHLTRNGRDPTLFKRSSSSRASPNAPARSLAQPSPFKSSFHDDDYNDDDCSSICN